jgi:hypothetical protein
LCVWISQNWLALYGAIVGTIALIINLSKFFHALNKDKVKLRITADPHPNKLENEAELADSHAIEPDGWQRQFLPVYRITVSNVGNVDAHIYSAFVLTGSGDQKHVLVTYPHDSCMHGGIDQVGTVTLHPKKSVKLNVYLNRGESKSAEVVDGTGRKWKAKI